jgi:hypothetical protein
LEKLKVEAEQYCFSLLNFKVVYTRFFLSGHKSAIVISLIVSSIFVMAMCVNNTGTKKETNKEDYFKRFAGADACATCHRDAFDKHVHTEHHLTSAPANEKNIVGSFEPGKNIFAFDNFSSVVMERRDSGLYQVEYRNGKEVRKGKFDIVVGSGRKGQSYLTWIQNRLVQLPITYFSSAHQWSNSPGYSPHQPVFNRLITSRCLECHSTYFEKISDPTKPLEEFDHNKVIYAVDCEKCHGPAAAHVQFQTKNPNIKEARYIINPGKLSHERLLDLCGLCHGGALKKIKPSFQFKAGDTLSNFFFVNDSDPNNTNIDVHGNQLGLLVVSKCFTLGNVTCINCHNVHENENNKIAIFSARCLTCHGEGHGKTCKMTSAIGATITQNCIDCHMPKQPSHAIAVYLQGASDPTPAMLRTHYITVYPAETQKMLPVMKKLKITKNTITTKQKI